MHDYKTRTGLKKVVGERYTRSGPSAFFALRVPLLCLLVFVFGNGHAQWENGPTVPMSGIEGPSVSALCLRTRVRRITLLHQQQQQ